MISVSVIMITFNHEQYVEKAIEGVLKQKGNFRIELIIGNDASNDRTEAICRRYASLDPRVKYFSHQRNLGPHNNFGFCYDKCKGNYIALCEGDDEWTDEHKIQKQLEELGEPGIVMSFTDVEVFDSKANEVYPSYFAAPPPELYSRYDVFDRFKVPTCTVLFKNILGPLPEWFFQTHASAYFLFYLLSLQGKLKYLGTVTARYNRHYSGLSVNTNLTKMLYDDAIFLNELKTQLPTDRRYHRIVLQSQLKAVDNLFHAGQIKKSIVLFWKIARDANSLLLINYRVLKLGIKVHVFPSLSKRKVEEYY